MTVKIQSQNMTQNTITLTNHKREITFHECANVALHHVVIERYRLVDRACRVKVAEFPKR
jgi:hypothetical protein